MTSPSAVLPLAGAQSTSRGISEPLHVPALPCSMELGTSSQALPSSQGISCRASTAPCTGHWLVCSCYFFTCRGHLRCPKINRFWVPGCRLNPVQQLAQLPHDTLVGPVLGYSATLSPSQRAPQFPGVAPAEPGGNGTGISTSLGAGGTLSRASRSLLSPPGASDPPGDHHDIVRANHGGRPHDVPQPPRRDVRPHLRPGRRRPRGPQRLLAGALGHAGVPQPGPGSG